MLLLFHRQEYGDRVRVVRIRPGENPLMQALVEKRSQMFGGEVGETSVQELMQMARLQDVVKKIK